MAIYKDVKIFDYYEANRGGKSEIKAQEVLDMILQEKDISLVSGNEVVGFVQEKRQVGRSIYATLFVSPRYLLQTAAMDYRIKEYEILRGAGGDMVCLHIEPLGEISFWDKLKFNLFRKRSPRLDGSSPITPS